MPLKTADERMASGARVRAIRERLGCSVDEFARYLSTLAEAHRIPVGVAYFTARDWERGTRVPEGDHAKVLNLAEHIAGLEPEREEA